MARTSVLILTALAWLVLARPAGGQTAPAAGGAAARPTPRVTAVRTAGRIAVYGRLDEADWARAQPAKVAS